MVSVMKKAKVYCRKVGEAVEVELKYAQLFRPVDTPKGPTKELVLERPLIRGSICSRREACAGAGVDCVLAGKGDREYLDLEQISPIHGESSESS